MNRVYESIIREHLGANRQTLLLTGPRQVGKTTSARVSAGDHRYYSWDRQSDRALITRGADAVAEDLGLATLAEGPRRLVLDEIHKYRRWRDFLKGFFDAYSDETRTIVTGSARLGFFRRGGDSLMGRYFPYRMHPLSLAELIRTDVPAAPIAAPVRVDRESIDRLLRFGGFPEPYSNGTVRFYNRWRRLRDELLFREDLRDLTQIQEVGQVEVLARILSAGVGSALSYSSLARDVNVAVDTVRRWIGSLEALFHCYRVTPWYRSVPKSLRRQPKVYLWDWSVVDAPGARAENFVASHLLKAVHCWADIGLGSFALHYVRDKAKREVDFLVVRDDAPWFLVEVKSSERRPAASLGYFAEQIGAEHAFQVSFEADYVERDCFSVRCPVVVPAATLLSQLV